ncbi:MAG TPA: Rieske (2Fe-2S) protein [Polyangiaceae bacterium]
MGRPTYRLGRRRFLVLAGVGVGAAGVACGSAQGVQPVTVGDVPAGNVSSLPVGSLNVVNGQPVCIGRDSGGVYAMTLTCTHAGCDIGTQGDVSPSGLLCGCHGSRFDANGNVVSGPAPSPLEHFAVSADQAGNLTIHGGQVVDAGQRLAVH